MRTVNGWIERTPREQMANARREQAAQERLAAISTKPAHKALHLAHAMDWRLAADAIERGLA
jgi:hypothetical protein